MIINLLNWIMIILSVITAFLSWRTYRITRASSILCIFVAMTIGVITRVIIAINGHGLFTTILSTIFWAFWTAGLYLLLKLLTNFMKTGVVHDAIVKEEGRVQGKAEGKVEGKAEGKAEGKVEGKAQGKAEGKIQGKAEGKAEGVTEGRIQGKAEGLIQGNAEGKAEVRAEEIKDLKDSLDTTKDK
jgi:hypothetical protein